MDHLTLRPQGQCFSRANGVSADGSVVAGMSIDGFNNEQAFRWLNGTMTGLGFLPSGSQSEAWAVNADGSVVAGVAQVVQLGSRLEEAFHWVNGTMTGLGFLRNTCSQQKSIAFGVSADGSTVVGHSEGSDDTRLCPGQAFRWATGSMVSLGVLPNQTTSEALGVSADGSVVVGSAGSASLEAVRWVNGAIMPLGFLGVRPSISNACCVSANGLVVFGTSGSAGNLQAVRWTPADGMRSIKELLASSGINTTGWRLTHATAASADGTTVVGSGLDTNGKRQGWIARLPLTPAGCTSEKPAVIADTTSYWVRAMLFAAPHYAAHGTKRSIAALHKNW
jgi:probable HAF family extracellular repeat protein